MEPIEKLISEYKEQIKIQRQRAKKNSKLESGCFYRVTQLNLVIKDLEEILDKEKQPKKKLKDCKLPNIKEFEVSKIIASADRYKHPFNTMTVKEIEDYLHLELQANVAKGNILFQERIGHIEALLLVCKRI